MWKTGIRLLTLSVITAGVLASLLGIWAWLDLPTGERLVVIVKSYFDQYGLIIVPVCAVIEGLLLIGWYFPGTFVIVTALIVAGANVSEVGLVAATAALSLSCAYAVNFAVGKFGWYRLFLAFGLRKPLERAKDELSRYGLSAIFSTYWQINFASVVSTAAGVLQFSFIHFILISTLGAFAWMSFWSILIYSLGTFALVLVDLRILLALTLAWIVARVVWELASRGWQKQVGPAQ